MDLDTHLLDMQQAFLKVYESAYSEQRATGASITPEVVISLSDGSLYAVDLLRREGETVTVVEISKTATPPSLPFNGAYQGMELAFAPAAWDALTLTPKGCLLRPNGINEWTEYWMDVDASHPIPELSPFGGVIHMIRQVENAYDIDFGTVPPAAMLAFLDIMAKAGCTAIEIGPTPTNGSAVKS